MIDTALADTRRYRGEAAAPAGRQRMQRMFRRGHRPELWLTDRFARLGLIR